MRDVDISMISKSHSIVVELLTFTGPLEFFVARVQSLNKLHHQATGENLNVTPNICI